MHYLRPLLVVIASHLCPLALAQPELEVIRASSIGQGTVATFATPYPYAIKCARQAVAQLDFLITSTERVDPDVCMILGKKPIAGDPYGEVIRLLIIRTNSNASQVRILTRRRATTGSPDATTYGEKIYAGIRKHLLLSDR